jgi:hypothetical protein
LSSSQADNHEFKSIGLLKRENRDLGLPKDSSLPVGGTIHVVGLDGFGESLKGKVCKGEKSKI